MVSIKGHAGSAPKGEDLVCCAVSTLFYSLVANLEYHSSRAKIVCNEGDSYIECNFGERMADFNCFRYFEIAIRELAGQYPDYIKISD